MKRRGAVKSKNWGRDSQARQDTKAITFLQLMKETGK